MVVRCDQRPLRLQVMRVCPHVLCHCGSSKRALAAFRFRWAVARPNIVFRTIFPRSSLPCEGLHPCGSWRWRFAARRPGNNHASEHIICVARTQRVRLLLQPHTCPLMGKPPWLVNQYLRPCGRRCWGPTSCCLRHQRSTWKHEAYSRSFTP